MRLGFQQRAIPLLPDLSMTLNIKENLCDASYFVGVAFYAIVVDVSYAQLMTIGSTVVYFTIMLVTRVAIARAKTHEAWIKAENLNLEPRITRGEEERAELRRRLDEAEHRIEIKNKTIANLSQTNFELAYAMLERKGVIRSRTNEAAIADR